MSSSKRCDCSACVRHRASDELLASGDLKKIGAHIEELETLLMYAEGDNAELEAKSNGAWPGMLSKVAEIVHKARKEHLGVSHEATLNELPDYTMEDARDLWKKAMNSMSEDHKELYQKRMLDWDLDPRMNPVRAMMIMVRSRWNDSDQSMIDAIATVLFLLPLELLPEYVNHNVYGFFANWRLEIGK